MLACFTPFFPFAVWDCLNIFPVDLGGCLEIVDDDLAGLLMIIRLEQIYVWKDEVAGGLEGT